MKFVEHMKSTTQNLDALAQDKELNEFFNNAPDVKI